MNENDFTYVYVSSFSLYQYVTLRTQYSELTTLTSQYIKFITDSQRRLEDDEVRDNSSRIPNKLNSDIDLTNQLIILQPNYHSVALLQLQKILQRKCKFVYLLLTIMMRKRWVNFHFKMKYYSSA